MTLNPFSTRHVGVQNFTELQIGKVELSFFLYLIGSDFCQRIIELFQ